MWYVCIGMTAVVGTPYKGVLIFSWDVDWPIGGIVVFPTKDG
mgnify:CR=1 FL=1